MHRIKYPASMLSLDMFGNPDLTSTKLAARALEIIEQKTPSPISVLPPVNLSKNKIGKKKSAGKIAVRHFKIWFSRPETAHPLGWTINELRLIKHQNSFKERDGTLSLITNYEDYPTAKKEKLISFCKKHHIRLKGLTFIFNQLCLISDPASRKIQLELFYIAMLEINNKHGSLAAASDIIRILGPSIRLGIYSDFDFHISDKIFQKTEKRSFKLNIKFKMKSFPFLEEEIDLVENHFILCGRKHREFLSIYHQSILKSYLDLNDVISCISKNIQHQLNKGYILFPNLEKYLNSIKTTADQASENYSPYTRIFHFRHQLKHILSEKEYNQYILISILYMSGPLCTLHAFNKYCAKNTINVLEVALDNSLYTASYESDCTWQPSGKHTMDKFEKLLTQSAIKLQYIRRQNKLKRNNFLISPEKKESSPHLPILSDLKETHGINIKQSAQISSTLFRKSNKQAPPQTAISTIKDHFKNKFRNLSVRIDPTELVITIDSNVPHLYIERVNAVVNQLQDLHYIHNEFKSSPELNWPYLVLKIPRQFISEQFHAGDLISPEINTLEAETKSREKYQIAYQKK